MATSLQLGGGQGLVTIGGSSSGTAHLSGIIALAWGMEPSASREEVIARLRGSSSVGRISGAEFNVGSGIPDAYVAAGGSRLVHITGPEVADIGASYTLMVTTDGWLPLNYAWNTGQTSRSVTFTASQPGTTSHSVTVTNPIDGRVLTARHSVRIAANIEECFEVCDEGRDFCMAEVGQPGGSRPQQCVGELRGCQAECSQQ